MARRHAGRRGAFAALIAVALSAYGIAGALAASYETVRGTPRDDRIKVDRPGEDRVYGLGGDDRLTSLDGGDQLFGGPGDDQVVTGGGGAALSGGAGDDLIVGSNSKDYADDGAGRDRIFMGRGPYDTVRNGAGNDVIVARGRRIDFDDGSGDDAVSLTTRRGQLSFAQGDDILAAKSRELFVSDGNGNDTYSIVSRGGSGRLSIELDEGRDTVQAFRKARLTVKGGFGREHILGGPLTERIVMFKGRTRLEARGGDDIVRGGRSGADGRLNLGPGDDSARLRGGDFEVRGGDGRDELVGGSGTESLNGGDGRDRLEGGGGADTIDAADGAGGDRVVCDPTDTVTADAGDQVDGGCLVVPGSP